MKVLDHGYVRLVEAWGSDERIIEAARMSTGKGFLGWGPREDGKPGDEKLLRYLWERKHATPFEMAGLIVEVQAPIFVFREWHRHRTQSFNELSARYVPMPDLDYMPTVERVMMPPDGKNKQAGRIGGASEPDADVARRYLESLAKHYAEGQRLYEQALAAGVPKELARIHLPVGRYSRMRASANLRNWLGFLALRLDTAAQWEIRQYAEAVAKLVSERFPRTWELFAEGLA